MLLDIIHVSDILIMMLINRGDNFVIYVFKELSRRL